ncbi:MAG: endonuclease/exonuclease/phosphatase family protein, partial [Phycisphaerae bacterium]
MENSATHTLVLALAWAARILSAGLIVVTVLPLLRTGEWWVRLCDFPRLQISTVMLITILLWAAHGLIAVWSREHWIFLSTLLVLGCWQVSHVIPFTPLLKKTLPDAANGPAAVRLLVANIKFENQLYDEVAESIRALDPDLLLLIEINDRWHGALQTVRDDMPHRVEAVADDGLGIALWSKLKLEGSHVEYLVSRKRASIFTTVVFADGRKANFVGLHPTPPGLDDDTSEGRRDSRERDAELVLVAKKIADANGDPWIVAGDFNDVAWSHTTRLFKRISGMLDPRVGRRLANTYHAKYKLFRYPIDHVFLSEGFAISSLSRAELPGSDHFAMTTDLQLQREEGTTPKE